MAMQLTGVLLLDNINEKQDEWLKLKEKTIGSSEISVVVEVNPYKSPQELYFEKRGQGKEIKDNEAMWWGRELESVVLKRFTEESTLPTKQPFKMYRHPEYEWATASPDAWVFENGEYGIVEAKTVGAQVEYEWQYAPPAHYVIQLQWQLGITGLKFGYLVGFLMGSRKLRYFRIEFDAELFKSLIETADRFMENVELGIPPLYNKGLPIPEVSDTVVELNEEWAPIIHRYIEVKRVKAEYDKLSREAEKALKPIKEDLLAVMGQAKQAKVLNSGYVIATSQVTVPPKTIAGYSYFNVKVEANEGTLEEA